MCEGQNCQMVTLQALLLLLCLYTEFPSPTLVYGHTVSQLVSYFIPKCTLKSAL